MFEKKCFKTPFRMLAFVSGLLATSSVSAALAEETAIGLKEYTNSCMVCHGEDGTGNGAMAETLTVKPADLTVIAKNNDGVFPLLEVFQIVDGRTQVRGHGTDAMPIWGSRYSEDIGDTYGPYGAEQVIRARLLELVFYIQSIQMM
ncbi:hypothetical protein GCM10016455_12520 [Aliiroseovarius zhejiangensis]|uniref:Cytochrome c domain-containing protein n=1 Tax=Aliiroseovarius zhejiangensis TaxID=1632025 RepID=A0ABQ3IT27_9RHOB|nr:cytochrome c [Aliiroseovarius zhejiangensis]GHE93823.1 hypothetical protein GCM10016455_12520 [Aliiroseovarius zhejiangensis]